MASVAEPSLAVPASTRSGLRLQVIVTVILALGMASYFWIDSRYPSLLKKLHSGKTIHTSGVLSFDALLPVTAEMPLATRIGRTSVNWMWTNRIGMTFGICFGSAMLTLLPVLPRRRFQSAAANTAIGAITGVPLGVCANCVAPIGQSLFQGGASASSMLATMFSSPLLNVVVLAMSFALFPFGVALTRVAVAVALIALTPWLVRGVEPLGDASVLSNPGWMFPVTGVLKQYGKNLARLAATTIPFMILAALLGAITAELIPVQSLPGNASILGVVVVALIGAFLPVPMAFDVAAAFILMTRGLPMPYVVTLLCTLGAFSIYSLLIVGRAVSWKIAARVFAAVAGLGMMAGIGTMVLQGLR